MSKHEAGSPPKRRKKKRASLERQPVQSEHFTDARRADRVTDLGSDELDAPQPMDYHVPDVVTAHQVEDARKTSGHRHFYPDDGHCPDTQKHSSSHKRGMLPDDLSTETKQLVPGYKKDKAKQKSPEREISDNKYPADKSKSSATPDERYAPERKKHKKKDIPKKPTATPEDERHIPDASKQKSTIGAKKAPTPEQPSGRRQYVSDKSDDYESDTIKRSQKEPPKPTAKPAAKPFPPHGTELQRPARETFSALPAEPAALHGVKPENNTKRMDDVDDSPATSLAKDQYVLDISAEHDTDTIKRSPKTPEPPTHTEPYPSAKPHATLIPESTRSHDNEGPHTTIPIEDITPQPPPEYQTIPAEDAFHIYEDISSPSPKHQIKQVRKLS